MNRFLGDVSRGAEKLVFVPLDDAKVGCVRVSAKRFGNYFRNIFALCRKMTLSGCVLGGFQGCRCGFGGLGVSLVVCNVSVCDALVCLF